MFLFTLRLLQLFGFSRVKKITSPEREPSYRAITRNMLNAIPAVLSISDNYPERRME